MSNLNKDGFFANLRNDFSASIVVFLVALPLCLGIALASGAPLFSGVIAGIVGGIVVSLVSGSPLGVSGPGAGLAVIVLSSILELGAFEIFLLAVVIAGVFQLILGFLKAGIIGYYFPSSVIKGMLSGIGIIIFLKQIPHAFGYDSDPEGDFAFKQVDGHNTFSELGYMLDSISPGAIIITAVSLLILILWEKGMVKKIPVLNRIPGALVAVVLGVGFNLFFAGIHGYALSPDQVASIPVPDSIEGFFSQFTFPDFSQWNNPKVYTVALTLAIVASLETLLCVEAADKLDPQKRVTPTNRELTAQGIGNIVSGFIGGLPITQVIVRSSANVQSGGKTKASAFLHGILLLVCVVSIPSVLNLVPLASLAAILLMVGYKLAKPAVFKEMMSKGKSQFIPFLITVLGIVFTDLLTGICLGMVVAIVQILWNNYKIPYHFDEGGYTENKSVLISLSEDVSFLNKARILRSLNQLPDGTEVTIDASKTRSIHPDVLEIIDDFIENAKTRNVQVRLLGLLQDNKVDPVEQFGRIVLKESPKKRKFNLVG